MSCHLEKEDSFQFAPKPCVDAFLSRRSANTVNPPPNPTPDSHCAIFKLAKFRILVSFPWQTRKTSNFYALVVSFFSKINRDSADVAKYNSAGVEFAQSCVSIQLYTLRFVKKNQNSQDRVSNGYVDELKNSRIPTRVHESSSSTGVSVSEDHGSWLDPLNRSEAELFRLRGMKPLLRSVTDHTPEGACP